MNGLATTGDEPVATATALLDGQERHLDPRYRIDLTADWLIPIAVVLVALLVGAALGRNPTLALVAGAIAAAAGAAAWGVARWQWRCFTWRAEPDALSLTRGVLVRRSSFVPYHRIQQIDVRQRPVQRLLGLATLVLRTAAATTDATLPGIPVAETEALRQGLLGRAGLDDAV